MPTIHPIPKFYEFVSALKQITKANGIKLKEDEVKELASVQYELTFLFEKHESSIDQIAEFYTGKGYVVNPVDLKETGTENIIGEGIFFNGKQLSYSLIGYSGGNKEEDFRNVMQLGVHRLGSDVSFMNLVLQAKN